MAVVWTLTGDGLAEPVELKDLGILNARLQMGSLEVDRLTFSQVFEDAATADPVQGLGKFELWRDDVRFFQGWVTSQRTRDTMAGGLQVDTVVSGVWWWLEQTPLSGMAQGTDEGDLKERIMFEFPKGPLVDNFIHIIDRAKHLGLGIDLGGITDCFDIPQLTLKQMSIAEAIGEMMLFIPDAVTFINYEPDVPTFNVKRRSVMAEQLLTVGNPPLTSVDVNPRMNFEASQVVISYVERGTDGRSIYREQVSGTATNGKRQIVSISGPELDTFLPNDYFDTYEAQTNGGSIEELALSSISAFSAAKAAGLTNELTFGAYSGTFYPTAADATATTNGEAYNLPGISYATPQGTAVDMTGKHIISTDSPPLWMREEYALQEVIVSGFWYYLHTNQTNDPGQDLPEPAWHANLPSVSNLKNGFMPGWTNQTLYGGGFTLTVWVSAQEFLGSTTLYKEAEYSFISPPADLAQNLLATQAWTPYEGQITLARNEAGQFDPRAMKINLANSLPAHASMGAVVQGVTMDLNTGTTTAELGTAKRMDFLSLVNRFRRTASDNILWHHGNNGASTTGSIFTSGGTTSLLDGTGNDWLTTGPAGGGGLRVVWPSSGGESGGWDDYEEPEAGEPEEEEPEEPPNPNAASTTLSAGGTVSVVEPYEEEHYGAGAIIQSSYYNRLLRVSGVGPTALTWGQFALPVDTLSREVRFVITANTTHKYILDPAGGTVSTPHWGAVLQSPGFHKSELGTPRDWNGSISISIDIVIRDYKTAESGGGYVDRESGTLMINNSFIFHHEGSSGPGSIGGLTMQYIPS